MIGSALDALATFRLQRLLGRDRITERPREALLAALWRRNPSAATWADEMLACPWCRTVWAAGAVLALRRLPGGRAARDLLALAGAASLLATHLDRED